MAIDSKGNAPILTKMVKKLAVRKNWRETKREQDRIVKYVVNQTKNAAFNYIITRPSDYMIRDKPSRKKLAASKSVRTASFNIINISSKRPFSLFRVVGNNNKLISDLFSLSLSLSLLCYILRTATWSFPSYEY